MENSDTFSSEDKHKLAHDLRNALSGAYMQAQMLEMSLSKEGLGKEKELAQQMQREIEKTLELISTRLA